MPGAYINRIGTAVPLNEVHGYFLKFATAQLNHDPRRQSLFKRMAERGGIDRRYSCIMPADDPNGGAVDRDRVFLSGAFPGTAVRMGLYAENAHRLAIDAINKLQLGDEKAEITHLIVTTCTGFSAPGVDLEIIAGCGLSPSVERTIIGFMGCYAAINGLKLARHIVRSEPHAKVLMVSVELCTLHLRETRDMEKLLSFCLWGDGSAAALVSAEPTGIRLDSFTSLLAPDTKDLMSWSVRDDGFDMVLSGRVPNAIEDTLRHHAATVLKDRPIGDIDLWAVHPGGRSVLDAVERALDLPPDALATSRGVLKDKGNMSSATVMFVLGRMLAAKSSGLQGCAMAFGPGLTAETALFETVQ